MQTLDWRDTASSRALATSIPNGGALWILAAEVLYPREQQDELVEHLFDTIVTLLAYWQGTTAKVFLAYTERSKSVTKKWNARAESDGFAVTEVSGNNFPTGNEEQAVSGAFDDLADHKQGKVFELSLSTSGREDLRQRLKRKETWEADFDESWAVVAPLLGQLDANELRDGARNEVLGRLSTEKRGRDEDGTFSAPAGSVGFALIAWHARFVLRQFRELVSWFTCIPALKEDFLIARAEAQRRKLCARLRDLRLQSSALQLAEKSAAHLELAGITKAIRQLRAMLHGVKKAAVTTTSSDVIDTDVDVEARIYLDGVLVASFASAQAGREIVGDSVLSRSQLIRGTTDEPASPPSAVEEQIAAVATYPLTAKNLSKLPPASLVDALSATYSAVQSEIARQSDSRDGTLLQIAEELLLLMDDEDEAGCKEWMQRISLSPKTDALLRDLLEPLRLFLMNRSAR